MLHAVVVVVVVDVVVPCPGVWCLVSQPRRVRDKHVHTVVAVLQFCCASRVGPRGGTCLLFNAWPHAPNHTRGHQTILAAMCVHGRTKETGHTLTLVFYGVHLSCAASSLFPPPPHQLTATARLYPTDAGVVCCASFLCCALAMGWASKTDRTTACSLSWPTSPWASPPPSRSEGRPPRRPIPRITPPLL